MGFYKILRKQTEEEKHELFNVPVIRQSLAGQIARETYIAFLSEAYHHVKHTVPLLMACGSRLPQRLEWLRDAVAEYIEEEKGHQEWILDDIAACGVDKEIVRHGRPGLATELMVAYAYDTINRGNPAGFFGMVQVLEGTSVALAIDAAGAIQKKLKLPDQALTYLRSHGCLDIAHMALFESLMDRVDDPADRKAILHCARVMYRLYADIFRSLPIPSKKYRTVEAD